MIPYNAVGFVEIYLNDYLLYFLEIFPRMDRYDRMFEVMMYVLNNFIILNTKTILVAESNPRKTPLKFS